MRPQYIKCSTFVAVLTPHYLEQFETRIDYLEGDRNAVNELLEDIWQVAFENKVCGIRIRNAFVYFRAKWNVTRDRWELELISITPTQHFHTHDRNYAILISLP